jgi:hypothetical protein
LSEPFIDRLRAVVFRDVHVCTLTIGLADMIEISFGI